LNPNLRFFLAVLAGLVCGGVAVALIEALGHYFFPPPESLAPEAFCAYFLTVPIMAFVFLLLAWGLGALIAGMVAKLVYRANNKPAFVAGTIQLIFVLINLFMIPCHPLWVEIIGTLLPVPMAMLGSRFFSTR